MGSFGLFDFGSVTIIPLVLARRLVLVLCWEQRLEYGNSDEPAWENVVVYNYTNTADDQWSSCLKRLCVKI